MVKFFEIEGRFPRHAGEVPEVTVDFVVRQLGVPADAPFEATGRAVERFRTQIREMVGFRVSTRGDEVSRTRFQRSSRPSGGSR